MIHVNPLLEILANKNGFLLKKVGMWRGRLAFTAFEWLTEKKEGERKKREEREGKD